MIETVGDVLKMWSVLKIWFVWFPSLVY